MDDRKSNITTKEDKMPENVKGKDIVSVFTLKSWFDQNSVGVTVGDKTYYIKGYELAKILQKHNFTAELARTKKYLTLDE